MYDDWLKHSFFVIVLMAIIMVVFARDHLAILVMVGIGVAVIRQMFCTQRGFNQADADRERKRRNHR